MRRVYIASSWKNVSHVRELARVLREEGHEVFDFTDAENRPDGLGNFVFNASKWAGKPLDEIDWKEFLGYDATVRAFHSDLAGLDWADTVVLLLPSGRSSHLEAGYAVGQGKTLCIHGDLPLGEFDAMYGFAGLAQCYRTCERAALLHRLRIPPKSCLKVTRVESMDFPSVALGKALSKEGYLLGDWGDRAGRPGEGADTISVMSEMLTRPRGLLLPVRHRVLARIHVNPPRYVQRNAVPTKQVKWTLEILAGNHEQRLSEIVGRVAEDFDVEEMVVHLKEKEVWESFMDDLGF
jgi:hypothetical protein